MTDIIRDIVLIGMLIVLGVAFLMTFIGFFACGVFPAIREVWRWSRSR